MANIPIRDIPGAVVASPDPSNLIPMDNGSIMQKTTIGDAVNTALPMASQAEAEAGVDNAKRMSPLRTKQAIDAQTPTIVNTAITALNLSTMSQEDASDYTPTSGLAAVALSNSYTDLSDLPTLGTAAATDTSDYATAAQGSLADTAIQPGDAQLVPSGGTTGQILAKNSGTNYDTGWVSSAAATAVSYAPQTLTDAQQQQARSNIGVEVATRTELKAIPATTPGNAIYLLEAGRQGEFLLRAGSIPVADPHEGWFIPSDTSGFYWERVSDSVYCDDFGPTADGVTNDEDILNSAAVVAAHLKRGLVLSREPGRTYAVENSWDIVSGVPAVSHGGGTIKLTNTTGFGGVYLRGVMSGKAENVKDCIVTLRVDANGKQAKVIQGENCSRVTFRDCYIWNATGNGYSIVIWASPLGGEHAVDNKIINNTIYAGTAAPTETSNGIMLIADNGELNSAAAYWKTNKSIPQATFRILRTIVTGNNINGGHYAVGLLGADNTVVEGNTCINNIRSVALQNQANDNIVSSNVCKDFYSSCIHVAYQSQRNLIRGNHGVSSRAAGEGLLQAYVGSAYNRFIDNTMVVTAGVGPRYYSYCAINAAGNVFQGNILDGPCQNAYMAVESGWEISPTDPAQRPGVPDGPDWASTATSLIVIADNTIRDASSVPLIFLSQITGASLAQCEIKSNKSLLSNASKYLHMLERNSGGLNNLVFEDNTWIAGVGSANFTFPRGREHFVSISGRLFTESLDVVGFAASDLTPSVAVGRVFQTANASATSITMFDDGVAGQAITVRLDTNTTIVHNNSLIRLRGGTNISGRDANSFVSFLRVGAIWYETSRNW